jgi:hypothetical protein
MLARVVNEVGQAEYMMVVLDDHSAVLIADRSQREVAHIPLRACEVVLYCHGKSSHRLIAREPGAEPYAW